MRKLSTILKINGEAIYDPDYAIQVDIDSITDSATTDDGVTHIDWIRTAKRKVYIKYRMLTDSEIANVLSKIQGKEYTLTYKDPILGINTINCFTSSNNSECYTAVLYDGRWRNVTFNCIEK